MLLAAAAPLLAALYDQSELLKITPVLALALPIGALSAVQAGRAQRAMAFRRFAFVENLAVGLSYVAAIVAAALGAGVWSLVVLALSRAAVQTVSFWIVDPWRPSREYDRQAVRSLMHFGGNLAGATSIAYWINNADNLLVGIFSGGRSLGIYSRAFTLMQAPLAQVSWAAQRVMFPALTRMHGDVARMRRVYLRAISLIAFVAFPLAVVVAVAAEPVVLTLLGPDWTDAVPILRILAIGGMLQAVATTGSWIFLAQGRTDWMLRWNLVSGPVTIAAFAIGIHWGAIGVAWAFLIRTIIIAPPALAIPGRLIGLSLWPVGRALAPTVAMCAVTGAVLVLADSFFDSAPAFVWLLLDLAVATVVYVGPRGGAPPARLGRAARARGRGRPPRTARDDVTRLKVLSVVGTRPNMMKVAPIARALDAQPDAFEHVLVHTGQHYDHELSAIFLEEFGLGEPDHLLQVGSGSHAAQTARVMERLEPVLARRASGRRARAGRRELDAGGRA